MITISDVHHDLKHSRNHTPISPLPLTLKPRYHKRWTLSVRDPQAMSRRHQLQLPRPQAPTFPIPTPTSPINLVLPVTMSPLWMRRLMIPLIPLKLSLRLLCPPSRLSPSDIKRQLWRLGPSNHRARRLKNHSHPPIRPIILPVPMDQES
jgi:hypothetical protein